MSQRSPQGGYIDGTQAGEPVTVWFGGDTAISEGMGLCWNWDYGTAADREVGRGNRVEVPTILNAPHFAGVAACAKAAHTGGQMVQIFLPGSICNVLVGASVTVGVGRVTCTAGSDEGTAGTFEKQGFPGKGSAVPLQTVDGSSTAAICLCRLEDGEESGLVEMPTLAPAGGADVFMVGGVTYFKTATTLAANITFTLADGVIIGQRKAFACEVAMTTSDVVITVTSGAQGMHNADPTATLATITLDAATEEVSLRWGGISEATALWYAESAVGSIFS